MEAIKVDFFFGFDKAATCLEVLVFLRACFNYYTLALAFLAATLYLLTFA